MERLRPLSPSAEVELHSVLLLVCIPTIWQLSGLAIVDAHTQRQSCVHQFEAVLSHTNPKNNNNQHKGENRAADRRKLCLIAEPTYSLQMIHYATHLHTSCTMQASKHTHLFKGELWVVHIHKVLVSCSSSKTSRVLATKPIQRLQKKRQENSRFSAIMTGAS